MFRFEIFWNLVEVERKSELGDGLIQLASGDGDVSDSAKDLCQKQKAV